MPKLYELSKDYESLLMQVADNEGEITPELDAALQAIGGEIKEKVEYLARTIKNLEGDQEAFKKEADRLSGKAKSIRNHIDWLKTYIKGEMERAQLSEVKGEVLKISVRPSLPSVMVMDEKLIPPEFQRVIPETREPDKKAIIANFKDGKPEVPGTMIAIGTTLTIR